MSKSHELDHDRLSDAPTHADPTRAPARGTRAQDLTGPTGPLPSGIVMRKQRDDNGVSPDAEDHLARVASATGGRALPDHLRDKFEQSLGADLSSVRVHDGADSAASASAVGAKAYTLGNDIHFGAGYYDPTSAAGEHLLAHEVAHTVQQAGGVDRGAQFMLEVSSAGDAHEVEADRAADAMVSGVSASVTEARVGVSRLFDEYSKDNDLRQLPPPPQYAPADTSFDAVAAAMEQSLAGQAVALPSPSATFTGSMANLVACRDNAESANVYYSHHAGSKWNPFDAGNLNGALAATAVADAEWAINLLADVRIAGSASGSLVGLLDGSNKSWSELTDLAVSMGITVERPLQRDAFPSLVDGKLHTKLGDETINTDDVRGEANSLAGAARKYGLTAPDTSGYDKARVTYNAARSRVVPAQRKIITTQIPSQITAIQAKLKSAEDEKDKWETIKSAAETFEKALGFAVGQGEFLDAEGGLGMKEGEEGPELKEKESNYKEGVKTGGEYLSKVFDVRIANIGKQIAAYQANLGNYTAVQEAQSLRASAEEYQNSLTELRDAATSMEGERDKMEKDFAEFGKRLDVARQRDTKAAKPGTDNQQSATLLAKIRTAKTTTQAALDGFSGGSSGDLPGLFNDIALQATVRGESQTASSGGYAGRTDARAAIYGIERTRWTNAAGALSKIAAALGRRQAQLASLDATFATEYGTASGGTDSIK